MSSYCHHELVSDPTTGVISCPKCGRSGTEADGVIRWTMRYWQIERLCGGLWIPTDFRESGGTAAEALECAERIARDKGWTVRLGKEVDAKARYCDFAWVKLD